MAWTPLERTFRMNTLNEQFFALINAASHPPAGLLVLGRIAVQDLNVLVPLQQADHVFGRPRMTRRWIRA